MLFNMAVPTLKSEIFTHLTRLVFSRFVDIRGNLGNAKEKPSSVHGLKKSDYSRLTFNKTLKLFKKYTVGSHN